jgi:2-polyprenyl-3-methyl-5-hydroxy-6-metoxy-1,4-benzoquinol methylase
METCNSIAECSVDKQKLFIKNGYPIIDCTECGRRFTTIHDVNSHLSRVYSDDYFFEGQDGYPNYLDEKDSLIKYGMQYAKVIRRYSKPGKVLDVGCAAGFIMKGFEQSGWDCYGLEPNETMASYGRTELNLNITASGLENYSSEIKFDLITIIQVIGSFYDVDKAIENVSKLLDQNGLVLVESWNMKSIAARVFGKNWHEYCPPSVTNWYSKKTLIKLFDSHGFEIIGRGLPSKRIGINHALSLVEKNTPQFPLKKNIVRFLSQTVGKFVVPYPPFDLSWYVFRKI